MGKKKPRTNRRRRAMGQLAKRIRATAATEVLNQQYDRFCQTVGKPRQGAVLRRRGLQLLEHGRIVEAHSLFEQAHSLIAAGDQSPPAASAAYQLAESLLDLPTGSPTNNIMRAQRLSEFSFNCPQRRLSPIHHSRSLDQMARIARRRAVTGRRPELLVEASSLYLKALKVLAGRGLRAELFAANIYSNLGNLTSTLGSNDRSIKYHREAVRRFASAKMALKTSKLAPEYVRWLVGQEREAELQALANLAAVLGQSEVVAENKEALALCEQVLHQADIHSSARRQVLLNSAQLHKQRGDVETALKWLNGVDLNNLAADELARYSIRLRDLGQPAEELLLHVLNTGRRRLEEARTTAGSDHMANTYAIQEQTLAAVRALHHMGKQEHGLAFHSLAEVMGQGFADFLQLDTFDLRDPVVAALNERRNRFSTACDSVEFLAMLVASGDPLHLEETIVATAQWLREEGIEPALDSASLRDTANKHRFLQERADEYRIQATRAHSALYRRHAERQTPFGLVKQPLAAMKRYPDHMFMVVHPEAPGVAVSMWMQEGELHSLSARIDLNGDALRDFWDGSASIEGLTPLGKALVNLLPDDAIKRPLVIVPSLLGHRVPWAAVPLGKGQRLIDAVRSIAIAPSLALYTVRRAPRRPREGTVLIAPGRRVGIFGDVSAFKDRSGTPLRESGATLDAVLKASRNADVVVFYTHGRQHDHTLQLQLDEGELTNQHVGDRELWDGMKRVELWACSSGLNRPIRPFLPAAHDAYGIDAAFLQNGVRSTIGTLWDVSDITTGLIAGRYGRALRDGLTAPDALATAQRWYLHEFLPEAEAQSNATELGRLLESHDLTLGGALGEGESDLAAGLKALSSPKAWAGFRFIGAPEEFSDEKWVPTPPLSDADAEWIKAALADRPEALLHWSGEDVLATARQAGLKNPTAENAIGVADAYRLRTQELRSGNLMLALGWNDLARARASEPELLSAANQQWAWLLFEVAKGGRPIYDNVLWPAPPTWLAVAREAAAAVAGEEGICLQALTEAHAARPWFKNPPDAQLQTILESSESLPLRERAHVLAAAAELAFACEPPPPSLITRMLALTLPIHEQPWAATMQSRINLRIGLLIQRHGDSSAPAWWAGALPNADLADSVAWAGRLSDRRDEAADSAYESLSEDFQIMQSRVWGRLEKEPLADSCRRLAAPDDAWHSAIGAFINSKIERSGGQEARRCLANLWLGCDPGLARVRQLRWMGAVLGRKGPEIAVHFAVPALLRLVQRTYTKVAEACYPFRGAIGAEPALSLPADEGWILQSALAAFNQYDATSPAILSVEAAIDVVQPSINKVIGVLSEDAFEAQPDAAKALEPLFPHHRLDQIERWMAGLPPNTLVLGVGFGIAADVVLTLYGQAGSQHVSRASRTGAPRGVPLLACLTELLRPPFAEDDAPKRRARAWTKISSVLSPALDTLLENLDLPPDTRLLLCMPGPFRNLPLTGIRTRGRPLAVHFGEVIHVPSHTLLAGKDTGLNPGCDIQVGGEGSQVALELADLDQVRRLSANGAPSNQLPEVDQLTEAKFVRTARFFGRTKLGLTALHQALIVAPKRLMVPWNLSQPDLLSNEVVELWFPTIGLIDSSAPLYDGTDELPAWVESAFLMGAGSVVDLAWDVPEPMLWTVTAHYYFARRGGLSAAQALVVALRAAESVIAALADGAEPRHALTESWLAAGLRKSVSVVESWAPDEISAALVPCHLGAFRLWGPA